LFLKEKISDYEAAKVQINDDKQKGSRQKEERPGAAGLDKTHAPDPSNIRENL